jgi:hypothetical protein
MRTRVKLAANDTELAGGAGGPVRVTEHSVLRLRREGLSGAYVKHSEQVEYSEAANSVNGVVHLCGACASSAPQHGA